MHLQKPPQRHGIDGQLHDEPLEVTLCAGDIMLANEAKEPVPKVTLLFDFRVIEARNQTRQLLGLARAERHSAT